MTTLVRVPDQFTPGAGTVATAATPTCCCCCCCCVASVVTTSAVLAEGLHSDLRAAKRRNILAVALITLGPLIAVAPVVIGVLDYVGLLDYDAWLGRLLDTHFGKFELVAASVGIGWTVGIAALARVRSPLASLGRFGFGVALVPVEAFFGVVTLLWGEWAAVLLLPMIVYCVHRYYRSKDDRG